MTAEVMLQRVVLAWPAASAPEQIQLITLAENRCRQPMSMHPNETAKPAGSADFGSDFGLGQGNPGSLVTQRSRTGLQSPFRNPTHCSHLLPAGVRRDGTQSCLTLQMLTLSTDLCAAISNQAKGSFTGNHATIQTS